MVLAHVVFRVLVGVFVRLRRCRGLTKAQISSIISQHLPAPFVREPMLALKHDVDYGHNSHKSTETVGLGQAAQARWQTSRFGLASGAVIVDGAQKGAPAASPLKKRQPKAESTCGRVAMRRARRAAQERYQ